MKKLLVLVMALVVMASLLTACAPRRTGCSAGCQTSRRGDLHPRDL